MPLSDRVYEFPQLPRKTFHGLPGCWPIRCPTGSATP